MKSSKRNLILGFLITVFIIAKMIGLENVRLGSSPFEIRVVAVLLPLAMIFDWYGIAGMTIGCTAAHAVNFHGFLDLFSAGLAALVGSILAFSLHKKRSDSIGLFAGTLIITLIWAVVFGVYEAYEFGIPLIEGFSSMLAILWIPVNVVGFFLVVVIDRFFPQMLSEA